MGEADFADDAAAGVPRRIVGFRQDDEGHWAAVLDCGHGRHVRHDPPWQVRPWVLSEAGRQRFVGTVLHCAKCVAESEAGRESEGEAD